MEASQDSRQVPLAEKAKAIATGYLAFAVLPALLGVGAGVVDEAMSGTKAAGPVPLVEKNQGVPLPNTNSWQPK